jgi:hypothetical protein
VRSRFGIGEEKGKVRDECVYDFWTVRKRAGGWKENEGTNSWRIGIHSDLGRKPLHPSTALNLFVLSVYLLFQSARNSQQNL